MENLNIECPKCGSADIELYYIDENGNPCDDASNVLNHQCKCLDCGHDDERCFFDETFRDLFS
jgi:predicted nucleic-acid-binding Zn-ribbon protein